MLPRRHTPEYGLRIPVLLIALTAGAVPVSAQSVPLGLGLPAEPGYVSLSGAVTFGFAATVRELHADPIGMAIGGRQRRREREVQPSRPPGSVGQRDPFGQVACGEQQVGPAFALGVERGC